jgi:hypothetical protein
MPRPSWARDESRAICALIKCNFDPQLCSRIYVVGRSLHKSSVLSKECSDGSENTKPGEASVEPNNGTFEVLETSNSDLPEAFQRHDAVKQESLEASQRAHGSWATAVTALQAR